MSSVSLVMKNLILTLSGDPCVISEESLFLISISVEYMGSDFSIFRVVYSHILNFKYVFLELHVDLSRIYFYVSQTRIIVIHHALKAEKTAKFTKKSLKRHQKFSF